jgi:hypothetical protein
MTDDKLVDTMRSFVTATNKLKHLSGQDRVDLRLLDQVGDDQREAAAALQQALVERGWRRPGHL